MNSKTRRTSTASRWYTLLIVALIATVGLVVSPFGSRFANAACSSGCVASMRVSPTGGTYNPGNTVTVAIYANSGGQSVNAVQANLSYNASLLQYQSINPAGSAFAIDAASSGGGGSVSIARGNISAVSGSSLLVAQVSFKALAAGTAAISFSGGSSVVSSSTNQDILNGTSGGSYAIQNPAPPPVVTPPPAPNPTPTPTPNTPTPTQSTTKKPAPSTAKPTTSTPQTPATTPGTTPPITNPEEKSPNTQTKTDTTAPVSTEAKKSNPWVTGGIIAGAAVVLGGATYAVLHIIRNRQSHPVADGSIPSSGFITGGTPPPLPPPVTHTPDSPFNTPNDSPNTDQNNQNDQLPK